MPCVLKMFTHAGIFKFVDFSKSYKKFDKSFWILLNHKNMQSEFKQVLYRQI